MALLAFFTILNVVNMIDRNLIIGFTTPIMRDLNLSNTQFGLLTGFVFTLCYTVVGVALGTIADRWHRPRLIACGLLLWSLMTAASGLARNFTHIAAARLFIGVGEATLTPTALSLLSDVFPPARRAMASGIYYAGVPIGVGCGFLFAGLLGPALGWRNCFFLMGGLGVLLMIPLLLVRDPARGGMELPEDRAVETHTSFWAVAAEFTGVLFRSPALMLTMLGSILTHFILGVTFLDQKWLIAERGYTQESAPTMVGLLFLIGGTIGTFAGGILGDRFHKVWSGGRLKFLAIGLAVVLPPSLGVRFMEPHTVWFVSAIFINCIGLTFFYGPVFSAVQDLAPIRVRSTSIAVLLLLSNLIGISGGALTAGMLIDAFESRGWEQPVTWGLFIPGLAGILAIPAYAAAGYLYESSRAKLGVGRGI
jgi:MFS transporter, Spinster family, sphingosine-1-phosphate transporter